MPPPLFLSASGGPLASDCLHGQGDTVPANLSHPLPLPEQLLANDWKAQLPCFHRRLCFWGTPRDRSFPLSSPTELVRPGGLGR